MLSKAIQSILQMLGEKAIFFMKRMISFLTLAIINFREFCVIQKLVATSSGACVMVTFFYSLLWEVELTISSIHCCFKKHWMFCSFGLVKWKRRESYEMKQQKVTVKQRQDQLKPNKNLVIHLLDNFHIFTAHAHPNDKAISAIQMASSLLSGQ
ncbi:uncharacterized protein LOC114967923 isoform X2 [Acropora millepora]|uniref:uncharacterized protein LOC114967923 isoform X2 n=1 Tax=Acropora millepora TaxID=45264 RepID=UPI001CF21C87|nr:uncharacterized protein LOC114967923 isoform X2 [Acropora millepora]